MPKVVIVQVIYNNRRFIEPVFSAICNQTFKDIEVVAVIAGNDDGGKELLAEKFPQVKIIDPGYNIGFAKGHNVVFEQFTCDYFQLVNPDMIMESGYVEKMVAAFEADPQVGAATGKLLQISKDKFQISNEEFHAQKSGFNILDTTGVVIAKSGRAWDRGQHEADKGQFDALTEVQAVSAAGAMYRGASLESVKMPVKPNSHTPAYGSLVYEYFDEDFHSYWEDVDLAWRMANVGWKSLFVPSAIGYHGRGAGSSRGGYLHVIDFIKHHRSLPDKIRELNYKNHIFMYIKNSPWFYPQFFVREFFMLIYTLVFETSTLKVLPEIFSLLPKMWAKRKKTQASR